MTNFPKMLAVAKAVKDLLDDPRRNTMYFHLEKALEELEK